MFGNEADYCLGKIVHRRQNIDQSENRQHKKLISIKIPTQVQELVHLHCPDEQFDPPPQLIT